METENISKVVSSVASKSSRLIEKTLGKRLPIAYLTIFAHGASEYDDLTKQAGELGGRSEANNGLNFLFRKPIETEAGTVSLIRVRQPDPYRSQIGCADFTIENYEEFKRIELPKHPKNMRVIERPDFEMIEFFDLEKNDVLAYIVSKPI